MSAKKVSPGKVYVVAKGRIASSRADGKDYHEGQEINLDHCTPEEIQNLINIGLVVEKETAAENEVNHG